MPRFAFQQVDVFCSSPYKGNPVAVVLGADGLTDAQMAAFANWTNLSETTFILHPTDPAADYRLRIFTPARELPFAGHPTLGSCHAWLKAGGVPQGAEIMQECAVGLVPIRRGDGGLAFAAPPLVRSGPVARDLLDRIGAGLGLPAEAITNAHWVDNGPGWVAVMLRSRADVLAAVPDYAALGRLTLGVVGPWNPATDGTEAQFEIRAFVCAEGYEDPVTGSLNASVAQWLIGTGQAPEAYVARQGTVLGRAGRIELRRQDGAIWVGGATTTCIEGSVTL